MPPLNSRDPDERNIKSYRHRLQKEAEGLNGRAPLFDSGTTMYTSTVRPGPGGKDSYCKMSNGCMTSNWCIGFHPYWVMTGC